MDAAQVLRIARRRAGLTQRELGERAGLSQPVVAAYERGRRSPSVPMLTKLLAAAGFELHAELVAARTLPDAIAASRTLEQALELASALPRRRRGALDVPPFARRRPA